MESKNFTGLFMILKQVWIYSTVKNVSLPLRCNWDWPRVALNGVDYFNDTKLFSFII